jgi:ketosteroid isomerase-like protein
MTNEATVARLLAALSARDGEAVGAVLHPEIVATGDKGTYEGIDAVVGWAKPSDDGHLVSRVEVDDIREVGEAHVALAARRRWCWKDDPETVADEAPFGILLEFRDGKVYRWRQNFGSIVEALEAIPAS